jgi:hypothetical protein
MSTVSNKFTKYQKQNRSQLKQSANKLIKKWWAIAEMPTKSKTAGKTPAQQMRAIESELNCINNCLKELVLTQINSRVQTLNKNAAAKAKIKECYKYKRLFSKSSTIEKTLELLKEFKLPAAGKAKAKPQAKPQAKNLQKHQLQMQKINAQNKQMKKTIADLQKHVKTAHKDYGNFSNKVTDELFNASSSAHRIKKMFVNAKKIVGASTPSDSAKLKSLRQLFNQEQKQFNSQNPKFTNIKAANSRLKNDIKKIVSLGNYLERKTC